MDLTERQKLILKAIVDDYIATAIPVGSRTLSRKYIESLSSATIRNEMADMEELGYLMQPHTSAGRIPSPLAYRLYVNHLLDKGEQLSDADINRVRFFVNQHFSEMEDVIAQAARVVSDMTQYTAIVMAPQLRRTTLKSIHLIPVTSTSAMVVIVTDAAVVKDSIIPISEGLDADDLHSISKIITQRFAGYALSDIDVNWAEGLRQQIHANQKMFTGLMSALSNSLVQPDARDLAMEGAANMFHYPEYQDPERAKSFLTLLQTRDRLYRLLSTRTKWEFTITIGDENADLDLKDCSVVTAAYQVGNRPMGSLGVIGPTRMDYRRVVGVLGHIGAVLGEMMSSQLTEKKGNEHEREQEKAFE